MASTLKLSVAAQNATVDAIGALLNGGSVKIYQGTQPATADTAISTQTLLSTIPFANPAFSAAVAGVATAHALTADSDAAATGTASFCRAVTSGGSAIFDGSCGTSDADCVLSSVDIVIHGSVSITACSITVPT